MPARPRRYDPAKVRTALAAETEALRTRVHALAEAPDAAALLDRPTRLPAWTVRELIAHLAVCLETLGRWSAQPEPAEADLDVPGYLAAMRDLGAVHGEDVAATAAREAAALPDDSPAALAARFDAAADDLAAHVARVPGARLLTSRIGAVSTDTFLVTRLLETVLHADDLQDATAPGEPFPHHREALAAVCRMLADALAARAPGGAVELRVPPFAVVQCIEGPRHTRGTPPGVVEADPLTWIRLAGGRILWAEALDSGGATASGERSDLGPHLPIL